MKKLVALTVTLALLLTFAPAAALAEPAGGSETYTGHYYSIETEWTGGGTVVLESSEDSIFDFMKDDDPHSGECFRFKAVPDEGYTFVGWEYWQELYIGSYDLNPCYDRVYRPSGEFINVHLNALMIKLRVWSVEKNGATVYHCNEDNISDAEIAELGKPTMAEIVVNTIKLDWAVKTKKIKAIFAPIEYAVTATAQGPGTLGAAGPLQYGYFESVTQEELNAFYAPAPNADTETTHYYFSGWFDADGVTPAVFPIEGGDRAVVAVFGSSDIVRQVTISASAGTGGSVAPLSVSVDKGVQADLNTLFTVTPDTGYEFAGWTDGEGVAIADGLITPTGDTQVVATFKAVEDPQPTVYTITATAGPGGSVTNAEATVNAGEPADLNALFVPVPADEYSFSGWEDSTGNTIEGGVIAAVNGDMAVKAVFAITIDDGEDPGGEVDDDDDDDDNDNPKTGGSGMPWIALLLFGLTGAGALATGRAMKASRARR